jgi:hypothetical protein
MRGWASLRASALGAILLASSVAILELHLPDPARATVVQDEVVPPFPRAPASSCPAAPAPAVFPPLAPPDVTRPQPEAAGAELIPPRRRTARAPRASASFIENRGQLDRHVRFYFNDERSAVWLTKRGVVVAAVGEDGSERLVGERFVGARARELEGRERGPTHVNVLVGKRAQWRAGLRTYRQVRYRSVWPGIDVRFRPGRGALRRDFLVSPGADPARIRFRLTGIERLRLVRDGSLVMRTRHGVLRQPAPRLYQYRGGRRVVVRGGYRLLGRTSYGVRFGHYARTLPLVIDPTLVYATFIGGTDTDALSGVAVDVGGSAYVVGSTLSSDYPAANAHSPGGSTDIVVTKLLPSGRNSAYSTYLGGTSTDTGMAIAVDQGGSAWLTGTTRSSDFPTNNAFQGSYRGEGPAQGRFAGKGDAFVAKLDSGGSLAFSSYLGGTSDDTGRAIAVDPNGAVVAGQTLSDDFPVVSALQPKLSGAGRFAGGDSDVAGDAFLVRVSGDGRLVSSTFLGGTGPDEAYGVALGRDGSAYVAGETRSTDFPAVRALQPMPRDGDAGFLAHVRPDGGTLDFATPLGGVGYDAARDVAVDAEGNAVVTGSTQSADFPTLSALKRHGAESGLADAFVAKVDVVAARLRYATYLGGTLNDRAVAVATDQDGNAIIAGSTQSRDFPTVAAIDSAVAGEDAFVATLAPDGSALRFATLLGGRASDHARDVAIDRGGNVYVTGDTDSADFPLKDPFQPLFDGRGDAGFTQDGFLAELSAPTLAPLAVRRITPGRGGKGRVSFVLVGAGLRPGVTVRLRRSGRRDVVATGVIARDDGLGVSGAFDLAREASGRWDVVARNPDGASARLRRAFTVEKDAGADLWLNIVGRHRIRAGRSETMAAVYGNRGNVDARGVFLTIRGIPADATWHLDTEVQPFPTPGVDLKTIPAGGRRNGQVTIPLYLPLVPAGSSGVIRFTLTVPTRREIQLRASASGPLFAGASARTSRASPFRLVKGHSVGTAAEEVSAPACLLSLANAALGLAGVPALGHLSCAESSLLYYDTVLTTIDEQVALDRANILEGGTVVYQEMQLLLGFGIQIFDCVDNPFKLLPYVGFVLAVADAVEACGGPKISALLDLDIFGSKDPNEKAGPPGVGRPGYVPAGSPLGYSVLFENLRSADAPAEVVKVEDRLDPRRFDLATFSFGPIVFGERVVVPPPGARAFTKDIDLRPANNLLVRVDARLASHSGRAVWTFRSLDPNTRGRPEDPLAGFLPPNKRPPEGEGGVFFTVTPKSTLHTGTQIRNRAKITFDTNAPITTRTHRNTVDASHPTSRITLARRTGPLSVRVRWRGRDRGSGIGTYDIYVSRNGGPPTPWLVGATKRSALFNGSPGRYRFYSVARDRVGNVELTRRRSRGAAAVPRPTLRRGHPGAPRLAVVRPAHLRLAARTLLITAQLRVDEAAFLRASVIVDGHARPITLAAGSRAGGRPASLPGPGAYGVRAHAGRLTLGLTVPVPAIARATSLSITLVAGDREGNQRTVTLPVAR